MRRLEICDKTNRGPTVGAETRRRCDVELSEAWDVSPRLSSRGAGEEGRYEGLINNSRIDFSWSFSCTHHQHITNLKIPLNYNLNMSSSNAWITPATLFKIAAALNLVSDGQDSRQCFNFLALFLLGSLLLRLF
jgi:hypothetical protein